MTKRVSAILNQLEGKQTVLVGNMKHHLAVFNMELNTMSEEDLLSGERIYNAVISSQQLYEDAIKLHTFNVFYNQVKNNALRADAKKLEKKEKEKAKKDNPGNV